MAGDVGPLVNALTDTSIIAEVRKDLQRYPKKVCGAIHGIDKLNTMICSVSM